MRILCGESNTFAVQDCLNLFAVGCRMDTGKHDLVLAEQAVFTRFKFFYLGNKITFLINLFLCINQLCSLSSISFITETGTFACALLHINLMSIHCNHTYLCRCGNNTVLPNFDILQYSKLHVPSSILYNFIFGEMKSRIPLSPFFLRVSAVLFFTII